MKVLILGGSGHVGRRLLEMLKTTTWAKAIGTSRGRVRHRVPEVDLMRLETLDLSALTAALKEVDAVINCVAGSAWTISEGARVLAQAAAAGGCQRIVHLSTMSVYGPVEGLVQEDAPLNPGLGWYGRAKCEAEAHIRQFASLGGEAVILRPGCVFGPGSELWVGRISGFLRARRLGDLGIAGDGFSNLVHVDDVCAAALAALQLPIRPGDTPLFNLAAPDSPRWNAYFVDLALQIQATPVQRIRKLQLDLDAFVASPALKIAQLAWGVAGKRADKLPQPMPPGLTRLWAQHIRLDARHATARLGLRWTPYSEGLKTSSAWWSGLSATCAPSLETTDLCTD